jgi:hypothetical protein
MNLGLNIKTYYLFDVMFGKAAIAWNSFLFFHQKATIFVTKQSLGSFL